MDEDRVALLRSFREMAYIAIRFPSRSKSLRGGLFDKGDFHIHSAVMSGQGELHSLLFFVTDGQKTHVIGAGPSRSEALAVARRSLSLLTIGQFADSVRDALSVREAEDAAYVEEQRRQWQFKKTVRSAKPSIPKRRFRIFEKSQGKCHYCETPLVLEGKWHIEHKMPKALLGTDADENLVASCTKCNHAKRDRTDVEFIASRRVVA